MRQAIAVSLALVHSDLFQTRNRDSNIHLSAVVQLCVVSMSGEMQRGRFRLWTVKSLRSVLERSSGSQAVHMLPSGSSAL